MQISNRKILLKTMTETSVVNEQLTKLIQKTISPIQSMENSNQDLQDQDFCSNNDAPKKRCKEM